MSKKRTATRMDKSDQKADLRVLGLRSQLDKANKCLKTLDDRFAREREKREVAERRCANRIRFEALLADLSANFVSLPTDQIDDAIRDAQHQICKTLDLDRAALWQITVREPLKMVLSHVHQREIGYLPDGPAGVGEDFPWIVGRILQGQTVSIASTNDLPPEADRDREVLLRWGVKSSLVLPLSMSGEIVGALSFGCLRVEKIWDEEIVNRIQIVTRLFTNLLFRQKYEKKLESRRQFEALVTDISSQFVNLPADRINAKIEDAHGSICECLGVELSAMWQWSDTSPGVLTVTHLYGPPESKELAAGIDAQDAFPWVLERVLRGEVVVLPTAKMPPEASRDEASRRQFDAKSSLVIPLSAGGGPILGVLDFNILKEERPWPERIVARLQLVAQIFTNAIVRQRAEEHLTSRRRFEALMTEISTHFVNQPADRIDAEIEDAQRRICECLDVDLSALWQWSKSSPHFMTLTHLHSPPDGPEHPEGINAKEAFPWVLERVLRGEVLVLSTDGMPREAAIDQESRRHFGVQSSVVIPLSAGREPVIGVLTFDNLKKERAWHPSVVENLCLLAGIFANALVRRQNDLKLQESRIRLRMATEAAGVGLWVMDADSGNVWATPGTRSLFQFRQGDALDYSSFDQRIDPSDRERVNLAVETAIRSGEQLDIEFRIAPPEGDRRWIKASGKTLPGAHGESVRLMGASIDISGHKKMEAQLGLRLKEIENLKQKLEKENIHLREEIELKGVHKEIVGRSLALRKVLSQVEQVAQADTTVLIEGETGTGKDLLAQAVHRLSGRKDQPLVTVNCASLPPTLVESELFGREKGAYTGALTRMTGRFEMADGATLFLDEIGELPLEVQAKLLRVLEQGFFERLGSSKSMKVDVRIIAATNNNLEKQVAAGTFRRDLYYRLNVFPLHLPPLRERPEDIPSLIWTFVREFETKIGKRVDRISHQCMEVLQRYPWPGNVRELRNVIERALIVSNGRTLEVRPPQGPPDDSSVALNLAEAERRHIEGVLRQTGWRVSGKGGAADILGLKRTTLQSKMKRLGIRRPPS